MLTRNESELLAVNMDNMHAFTVRLHLVAWNWCNNPLLPIWILSTNFFPYSMLDITTGQWNWTLI